MLGSAVRHLGGAHGRRLLVAGRDGSAGILLPLALDTMVPNWLARVATVWAHDHCYDTTPLVRGDFEPAIEALFSEMAGKGLSLLRWPNLPLDTAFAERLLAFLDEAGLSYEETKTYRRPMLVPDGGDPQEFLKRHLGKSRLKDLRRRRRRMAEAGKVDFRVFDGPHDAAEWCEDFLALEASGWKGAAGTGTAIACSPAEAAFFRELAADGAAAGKVLVHSLTLDGEPAAMTVNFRSGDGLWAYKSAYRQDLSHLAPGVQVEFEGSLSVFADPQARWFDSCTTHEGGVLGELWPDRRPIADLLIAVTPRGNALATTGSLLWRQYLALKGAAKARIT